jgi:hypothetical protein
MSDDSNEQRGPVVEYQMPEKRRPSHLVATLAFVLSMVCIAALVLDTRGVWEAERLFFVVVVGGIGALLAGIVGLRLTARQDRAGKAQAWFGAIFGGAVLGLLAWGVIQDVRFGNVKEREERVRCQSRVRQVGQGLLLYASDHGGQFPPRFDQLISEEDISPEEFICPSTNDQRAVGATLQQKLADFRTPGHCSYIYLGAGMTTATVTKDFVLAYEPLEHHENRGAHFIFGDCRAEWRDGKEARKMIEQLKGGVNPPKP